MAVRKEGRKKRALERAKWQEQIRANLKKSARDKDWYDDSIDKRIEECCGSHARVRIEKRAKITEILLDNPGLATRKLARVAGVQRATAAQIREELGFVVPKKDYRCYKARYDFPPQPGEVVGVCACGCGQRTTQAKNNNQYMRAGQFYRFIAGHQWRIYRANKPKGWRSSSDVMKDREQLREQLVVTAAKLPRYTKSKVATFEDLRNRMKKIELQGHTVVDQQVSRMINVGRWLPLDLEIPTLIHANVATKAEWLERLVSVSLSAGKATIEFDDLKRRFNEPMLVPNHAVSRLLNKLREEENPDIPFIVFRPKERQIKQLESITEFYPYGAQDDLLRYILSVIPERYCGESRADIAQDMALAVLSGECTRENLAANISKFTNGWHRRFAVGQSHKIVSLDAPLRTASGDFVSLHELLDAEECMTELTGGTNWETREKYFERSEDFDGRIVAHY